MRIVIDGRSIHSSMGGIGVATLALIKNLAINTRKHALSVILGSRAPQEITFPNNMVYLRTDAAMIDPGFEQFRLPALLEDLKADLYVNPSFSIPAIKTCKFQIAFIHDVVFEEHPEWVEASLGEYLRHWSRFAAREADRIVTVSQYSKKRITAVYGIAPERIEVIYNGIDTSGKVPENEIRSALVATGIRKPFLLYLGSVEPKKGIPELLQAFSLLTQRGCDVQLVLAGGKSGPAFDLEGAINRTSCPDQISCLGYIDETTKQALLAGCQAFVYPSHYEGFGIPPLEALSLGKPCVVSNKTALPEITGNCALQVNIANSGEFCEALIKAVADQEYRRIAEMAGPEWCKRFSWKDSAAKFLDLCESLGAA